MIYLIDDNQFDQRRNNYNLTFIEEGIFDGYLLSIEKLEKGKDFADFSHLEFLKAADCIVLHATIEDYDKEKGFLSGSTSNALKIKEFISQEGDEVPLVVFSNAMGEPEFDFEKNPNYIRAIKKNLLYDNLFDFLNHYKKTGDVDLRIIAMGKNFIHKKVSELTLNILKAIESKEDSNKLQGPDLKDVKSELQTFIELSFPDQNAKQILNNIEKQLFTIQEFKLKLNKINESFIKYGKNIYNW